jgi:hypothetical protein
LDPFSKSISKTKERRFKTNWSLSLILRFNLRLGGYSIWSAIFIAACSLEAARKVLGRHIQGGVLKNSKMTSKVLGSLQYSATKRSRTCQR